MTEAADLHFALDIGTRKVVGLLTRQTAKGLQIVAAERLEHQTRAMYDGQIHDVVEVTRVVQAIKQKLEAKTGAVLKEAAVAAAGRALRTFAGGATREFSGLEELTGADVLALEIEAVQSAQRALASALKDREQASDFHYVGHSVMRHRLDGLQIVNLVGQRGQRAELEVIATFLPRGVVDSLLAVLQRCDLEMTGLTLEPIAAISVVIPPTMRHLNLALVDIGAGTSDIALTARGSIIAYDMVPFAGDEVTEVLSEHYLLDFPVGETVKRQVNTKAQVTFTDILGLTQTVPSQDLLTACSPAVSKLAGQIAERVLKLNGGQPPQAVVLVGGGSQSPGLGPNLAAELGLPENRVAVRGREAIAGVIGANKLLAGPDSVTPIGIAVTGRGQSTAGFAYVHVNGTGVRLVGPSRRTVADALLGAGVEMKSLQPKLGRGLTISVDGQLKIIRGTFGRPASLSVNGQPAGLDTPVSHRDQISWIPPVDGEPGQARLADVVPPLVEKRLYVNDEFRLVAAAASVNGQLCPPDTQLRDNDQVIYHGLETVGQALAALGYTGVGEAWQVRVEVNGESRLLTRPRYRIRLNGELTDEWSPVHDGDSLTVEPEPQPMAGELASAQPAAVSLRVNGEPVALPRPGAAVLREGRALAPSDPLRDGDRLELKPVHPLVADALARVQPLPRPGQSQMQLLLNGQPTQFSAPVADGDQLEIVWH